MNSVFIFLLLAATSAAAEPVKCVDAKGKVRYIDRSMMAQEKCEPVKDKTQMIQTQPGAIKPSSGSPNQGLTFEQRAGNVRAAEAQLEQARKALADRKASGRRRKELPARPRSPQTLSGRRHQDRASARRRSQKRALN